MKIRWNTTNAEIERGVTLQPALTRWNAELSRGLTGKKKTAAIKKAKRQYLSPDDFDNLRKIVNVMTASILQEATLDLSKKKVPTICKVLPLYKIVQTHLEGQLKTIPPAGDTCNLRAAIQAGLAKLKIHTEKALISDYPLIGAVLHPAIRLVYFESGQWDSGLASRARIILEHLYDVYKEEWEESNPPASTSKHKSSTTTSPSKGIFRRALASGVASGSTLRKLQNELEVFFSGIYPMADDDDDVLAWWKVSTLSTPYPTTDICPVARVGVPDPVADRSRCSGHSRREYCRRAPLFQQQAHHVRRSLLDGRRNGSVDSPSEGASERGFRGWLGLFGGDFDSLNTIKFG
ncbi:hypothetical protein C8R46DRAFT_884226 [Mycena filopes]|nr:hypothetical protein C8R46DRAFT_884226 [Mycena filopes]